MNKLLTTLLTICLGLGILASPVRDSLSARMNADDEDSGPRNLWTWPTAEQSKREYHGQGAVWKPEVGVWYGFVSERGYVDTNMNNWKLVGWTEASMSTIVGGSYSSGVFMPFLPGTYSLGCDVDGRTQIHLGYYEAVSGGFKWKSFQSLRRQTEAGYYERTFTVPDGCSLVMFVFNSDTTTEGVLTVTDIEIYHID